MGNVHQLVIKESDRKIISIIPILKDNKPTWGRFSLEDIEQMKKEDEDFEGERMCRPSASRDVLFDRETLDNMPVKSPTRVVNDFKIYNEMIPSHRYASAHDVAGGVGLDSSTSVFIDFECFPAQVVATYHNNLIKPDVFGDEIYRQSSYFGYPLTAPEKNNHGHATIARLRQLDADLYVTQKKEVIILSAVAKEYGWHTNGFTKPKMLFALAKAVEDGHLLLNDPDLIQECKSYTRNDLMDKEEDARLTTRHFDILVSCAICWQMKDFATYHKPKEMTDMEIYEARMRSDNGAKNFSR
jgi:hypothetical protein